MAQQSVTALGGGSGGSIREDLANFVSNIDRDETPFMSAIGSTKAKSTEHSWLTDEYNEPIAQTVSEGAAFTDTVDPEAGSVGAGTRAAMTNRTRLNNFTQIFRAQIEVSGTSIATDTAGVSNEYAYQLRKKGVEVRRNAEFQATRYSAASGDATKAGTTAIRRMGSIYSYSANNVTSLAAGTVTAGHLANGTTVPVSTAALTAFARPRIEALVTGMYGNGGKPNMFLVPHTIKTAISAAFNSDSTTAQTTRRLDSMEKKLNLAITGVITDFGFDIAIMPSYIPQFNGGENTALLFNSSDVKKAVLRPMHTSKLDDNGDGKRGLIIEECTLQVMNPNSIGALLRVS